MKVNDMFPSEYIKTEDLGGIPKELVIMRLEKKAIPNPTTREFENKWVLFFQGWERGLILNKTNARFLASSFGDNSDTWIGQKVVLYPTETPFGGDVVACMRFRLPDQKLPDTPEHKAADEAFA